MKFKEIFMDFKEDLRKCIRIAMGLEPADTLILNANIVSTFTEEIFTTDIAIANGKIVALGGVNEAKTIIDVQHRYICPAFIDAHIHIESSMCTPEGFAEAVVPHGTGTVISDPHEIVNVLGLKGWEYMLKASKDIPLKIFYGIPSCVPATQMETTGGYISAEDIRRAYQINPNTIALSEMMNYPGVYLGFDDVLDKICVAKELGLRIDGHSPTLKGKELNAYLNAQILTDHECSNIQEAIEKLRRGMYVLIREGSAANNLRDLISILSDNNAHRIAIISDDRHPDDLLTQGHLDYTWQKMIGYGISPIRALRMMTLNPAIIYGIADRGGIGVGYRADFFIVENLERPVVQEVFHDGMLVAKGGCMMQPIPRKDISNVVSSVHLPPNLGSLLHQFPKQGKVRAIGIIPGQLVTENLVAQAEEVETKDMAYLAVIERYGKNANVGLGFVKNFGLQQGALASTVAHDNHNLIILGKSLTDMEVAAQAIEKMGGGFVFVHNGRLIANVDLPIAGLMSPKSINEISNDLAEMSKTLHQFGVAIQSPFMVLSFLALSVIPHLKLTDHGLVDVDRFCVVPLVLD